MKFKKLFEDWGLTGLKLNLGFLEADFNPTPEEEEAAWEMYVELITRVTTQELTPNLGDEKTALESIYSLFDIIRDILKRKGRNSPGFTKISIIVLNQIIRPFTTKWHTVSLNNEFQNENCQNFRGDLVLLQEKLLNYSKLLASIAKVEDLSNIENGG